MGSQTNVAERRAALGGPWFVVLGLVAAGIGGTPPDPDAPAAEVRTYLADTAGRLQAAQVLFGLASIGLLWWFGALYRRMSAAEGERPRLAVVAALGLVWSGVFYLLSTGLTSAAAMRAGELGDTAGFAWGLVWVLSATASVGNVVLLAAVSVLVLRHGTFARWIGYVGWVAAALFGVGLLGAGSDTAVFSLVGGFGGFLVWCVWIVGVSWALWQGQPAGSGASAGSRTGDSSIDLTDGERNQPRMSTR